MRKRVIIGGVAAGLTLLGIIGSSAIQSPSPSINADQQVNASSSAKSIASKTKPTCDGTTITTSCTVDGVTYSTYIYHPATPEKSHVETVTTYQQKITGYCTLCNDGTYSPSCATGRGACSYHDGVAQWNAPVYSSVPEYSTKTVVDAPAEAAYYEKVAE